MRNEREDLSWEEIKVEQIVHDEWIDIRKSAYKFPDGRVFEPYYSYSRKNFVVIVAKDTQGNLICVRQYRQGVRKVTTEFPAGAIEKDEDPLVAAKRELREETGYEAEKWTYLITAPENATIADNYAHVYYAENCKKVSGQSLDETEFLNVEIYTPQELEKIIFDGNFEQCIHIMAYFMVK